MTESSLRTDHSFRLLQEATELLGREYVAFHPRLAQLTGSVTAGLMLSQALYWTRRLALSEPARQGWFWKTRDEWSKETGLSRWEQESTRRCLKQLGVWHESLVGMPAKTWYRVDLDRLGRLLAPQAYTTWDWRNERVVLQLVGRPFLFYRHLAMIAGGVTAAVLLSNFLAQERASVRGGEKVHWRIYQFDDLRQKTGLSRHELDAARQKLRQFITEERRLGVPPRVEWRVRIDRLVGLLSADNSRPDTTNRTCASPTMGLEPAPLSSLQESCKQVSRDPANKSAGFLLTDFPKNLQLDFRFPSNRISEMPPTSWADSGKSDGANPENLYKVLTTGFRTTTPTPPTPSARPNTSAASAAPGRGWFDDLVWPKLIRQDERQLVIQMLELTSTVQYAQTLLDELAGQGRLKNIASPLGYLNTLINKAVRGEFVPISALRERARRDEATKPKIPPSAGQTSRPDKRSHAEGLATLRSFMSARMGIARPPWKS